MKHSFSVIVFVLLITLSCSEMNSPTPPVAKKVPKEMTIHGDTRVDNYY